MANHLKRRTFSTAFQPKRSILAVHCRVGLLALVATSMLASSGCTLLTSSVKVAAKDVHTWVDDSMASYRDRTLAEKSWIDVRAKYRNHEYLRDFKRGFIDGYQSVADGGNGCTPPLAPSEYWGWKYQSPYGQAAVRAWFEGFPIGARAAQQDGVGNWSRVQLNLSEPQVYQPPTSAGASEDTGAQQPTVLETSDSATGGQEGLELPIVPGPAVPQVEGQTGALKTSLGEATAQKSESLDTLPAGTVSVTDADSGNGEVNTPASYDDWLREFGKSTEEEKSPSDVTEIQFESPTTELPFTLE